MDLRDRLQRIVDSNPAPFILDRNLEERPFTHKSFYSRSIRSEVPMDWGRLAFFGAELIPVCVTEILLERYKTARPKHLARLRARIISVDTISQWSDAYQFPQRIHASPNQEHRIRSQPKHRAAVFEAYVGAVFYSEDLQRVRAWLRPLIEWVLQDVDDRRQFADSDEEEDDDEVDDGETETATTRTTPTGSPYRSPHEVILPGIRNMLLGSDLASQRSSGSTPMDRMSLLRQPAAAPIQHPYRLTSADVHANAPGVNSFPSISKLDGPSHQPSAPPIPQGITTADVRAIGGGRFATVSSESPGGLKFHPHGTPSTSSTSNPTPLRGNPPLTPVSLPQSSPPPRPSSTYTTASSPPSGGYLALFNQLASQKHIEPEWIATSSGPAHRPTFNAIVKINGQVRGRGYAFSKQTAKHMAAKDALDNLGWHQ